MSLQRAEAPFLLLSYDDTTLHFEYIPTGELFPVHMDFLAGASSVIKALEEALHSWRTK